MITELINFTPTSIDFEKLPLYDSFVTNLSLGHAICFKISDSMAFNTSTSTGFDMRSFEKVFKVAVEKITARVQ